MEESSRQMRRSRFAGRPRGVVEQLDAGILKADAPRLVQFAQRLLREESRPPALAKHYLAKRTSSICVGGNPVFQRE